MGRRLKRKQQRASERAAAYRKKLDAHLVAEARGMLLGLSRWQYGHDFIFMKGELERLQKILLFWENRANNLNWKANVRNKQRGAFQEENTQG